MLKLSCYVRGDDFSNVFIVKIDEDETVAALRKAIKEKKRPKFDDIPAKSLSLLWKASVHYNPNLEKDVEALGLVNGDSLQPLGILSDIFSSDLEKNNIHIIVNRPHSDEL